MLWKKESTEEHAFYEDIIANNGGADALKMTFTHVRYEEQVKSNKDDKLSLDKRKMGNKFFKQEKWADAMEMYNASLRYAENGSENISLAYANRSNCFLKLKRYNECLVDIQLAKEARYPPESIEKLNRREEECLKHITDGAESTKYEAILDFEPDEKFPCMANVLEIKNDSDGDLRLFAKDKIDVGQTIVVEKALINYIYSRYSWRCDVCLKEYANFVPCDKCVFAMFCDDCRNNQLHQYECGVRFSWNVNSEAISINGTIMSIVRSCLWAIDLFASVDELMVFVERVITSDPKRIPNSLSDAKSQYEAFLKLPRLRTNINIPCILYECNRMLMNIPKIEHTFNSVKHHRFLMHLIGHHAFILKSHSIPTIPDTDCHRSEQGLPTTVCCTQTGLMRQYINVSCYPNVMEHSHDGQAVVIAIRPILKGQQLFNTSLFGHLFDSKERRHEILRDRYEITCKCERCEGHLASDEQRKRITSDPNFRYLKRVKLNIKEICADKKRQQTLDDKYKSCLRKFGQMPWCDLVGKLLVEYMILKMATMRSAVSTETAHQTD
ncbi:uncharacterized protein LOC116348245 [Contarinia nasturtii]|uniref:uncharacterized protein LOC116348245 n=1 Tax=Contarinia nasturtii TaxID=265458 RepID=UPI0012D4AD2A|nr:uncharacterized protein LOC116348245 [Contarinia nasturtii]